MNYELASAPDATFRRAGYVTIPHMLNPQQLHLVDAALNEAVSRSINLREILEFAWCRELSVILRNRLAELDLIAADYLAVQCTYFEKSVHRNWLVALHQDLSIPVQSRVEHPELSGWSIKDGTLFVRPPLQVLERLVALRLHIDECGLEDGALRVTPGSHRAGRLSDEDKLRLRVDMGEVLCPVTQGGGMAMSPLVLHASSKATGSSRRRVLHFLFGPPELPNGLSWVKR